MNQKHCLRLQGRWGCLTLSLLAIFQTCPPPPILHLSCVSWFGCFWQCCGAKILKWSLPGFFRQLAKEQPLHSTGGSWSARNHQGQERDALGKEMAQPINRITRNPDPEILPPLCTMPSVWRLWTYREVRKMHAAHGRPEELSSNLTSPLSGSSVQNENRRWGWDLALSPGVSLGKDLIAGILCPMEPLV